MSKTYRRLLATLLLGAVVVFVVSRAQAADEQKVADRIASFVQGRLISIGGTVYHAASVRALIDTQGELYLQVDADPVYPLELKEGAYFQNAVAFYEGSVPREAKCAPAGLDSATIEGTDISVRKGNTFLSLRDALQDVVHDLPRFDASSRPVQVSSSDVEKLRACARTLISQADAAPFKSVEIYSGKQMLTSVGRTIRPSTLYEYGLGEDTPVSHIVITPRKGKVTDYSVEVRAVSVMHCDYEGPHIELDRWKHGYSAVRTLRRKDGVFLTDKQMSDTRAPKFPAYTQSELRRAIKAHFGEQGLASREKAKPCAPFLHGHRITVKYRSKVVHEIAMTYPGGC